MARIEFAGSHQWEAKSDGWGGGVVSVTNGPRDGAIDPAASEPASTVSTVEVGGRLEVLARVKGSGEHGVAELTWRMQEPPVCRGWP
jgi:hypothetical protein